MPEVTYYDVSMTGRNNHFVGLEDSGGMRGG